MKGHDKKSSNIQLPTRRSTVYGILVILASLNVTMPRNKATMAAKIASAPDDSVMPCLLQHIEEGCGFAAQLYHTQHSQLSR